MIGAINVNYSLYLPHGLDGSGPTLRRCAARPSMKVVPGVMTLWSHLHSGRGDQGHHVNGSLHLLHGLHGDGVAVRTSAAWPAGPAAPRPAASAAAPRRPPPAPWPRPANGRAADDSGHHANDSLYFAPLDCMD